MSENVTMYISNDWNLAIIEDIADKKIEGIYC